MNINYANTEKELDFSRFKKFFLLQFTRRLIRHSAPKEIFEFHTALEKERESRLKREKEKIRRIIREKENEIAGIGKKEFFTNAKEIAGGRTKEMVSIIHPVIGMFGTREVPHFNPFGESFRKPRLLIPESKFPVHIQYIKPVPLSKEIELGKLDSLIMDSMVDEIECHGAGQNILVQGNMGNKKTGIVLDSGEIDDIIQKFSRETKIPAQEGIFKVVVGRLILLAIISEIVGSKFIIKKMPYEPPPQPPRNI